LLERQLLSPNGGVIQMKRAMQSVHTNMRVVTAVITFNRSVSDISIDGVPLSSSPKVKQLIVT